MKSDSTQSDVNKTAAKPAKKTTTRRTAVKKTTAAVHTAISYEERHRMIEECAYFLAQRRGFAPGHEQHDWRSAESEIDALLTRSIARVAAPRA